LYFWIRLFWSPGDQLLLLGQVIDEDEVRTGVRREGSFMEPCLITKPAQSLAVTITAAALAAGQFVTRDSNAGMIFLDQPESALFAIRAVMGLILAQPSLLPPDSVCVSFTRQTAEGDQRPDFGDALREARKTGSA
jgi:hypothetical protein